MRAIRRVVTGHDTNGKAMVLIDGSLAEFEPGRAGASSALVWTNDRLPADNQGSEDAAKRTVPTVLTGGSVFRVIRYEPGVAPRTHRTASLDYAVVLSGSIDMHLDEQMVTLHAGDILVQRGTVHDWVNRGPDDCIIAFVLISASPITVGGHLLEIHG